MQLRIMTEPSRGRRTPTCSPWPRSPYAAEHEAYGVELPGTGVRFERFEEQVEIVTGLWATGADETFSYNGRHYQLRVVAEQVR